MVNSNKVLTVSYGTFSCTLEGFEDSFDTMKAIAEYFRDLAADDRYFGAEPPQPDADMLARIAQREAARQVEARIESREGETGIVLRAAEPAEAEMPAATPEVAPVSQTDPVIEIAEEPAQSDETTAEAAPDVVIETVAALEEEPAEPTPEQETDVVDAIAEPVEAEIVEPAENSIAAKLQRIRAVVSRNTETVEDAEFVEDQHAETAEDEDSLKVAETLDLIDADTVDQDDSCLFEDIEDEEDPTAQDIHADEDADDDLIENILSDVVEDQPAEPAPAPKVLVKKVKRTELDAAVALSQVDDADDDAADGSSSLSAEDEEDLLRELAMVEAEFAPEAPEPLEEVELAKFAPETAPEESDDDAMDRLMDAAGARMDDPETSTKSEAYSHLRAAVAATEAERDSGGDMADGPNADDYRADLAQVVKPRRPVATGEPRQRDAAPKVAPLKLVAEQRVDYVDTPNVGPVVPRRVSALPEVEEATGEDLGFIAFVAETDAISLPDLLEAAASYLTHVEGRAHFSRPQLMNKIRAVHTKDFNREDGLRAFGQLLRNGKLIKAGGGRFSAAADIGFQPDERAAM